jgi:ketosteroid isomerase-like protein
MITGKTLLLPIAAMLLMLASCSSDDKKHDYREQLTILHQQRDRAFITKDSKTYLQSYADSVIAMPEYHAPVYGKQYLEHYYRQWFDSTSSTQLKRDIYEVQRIGNYILDIGRFTHDFKKADSSLVHYEGKYMNVWAIGAGHSVSLISEIWGSEFPINSSLLSFAAKSPSGPLPGLSIDPAIEEEVNTRYQHIAAYVKNRQGTLHATEMFLPDAIYLTYDTTMLVGMNNIEPYFTEHEKPGPVSIDSISLLASRMIPVDSFVLEYGYYFVAVSWDNHKGGINVKGKSTNLWKRNNEGKLMMWRQMVNHD